MNVITLYGRIATEIESGMTSNDKNVSKFKIADNKDFGEGADFIPCRVYGNRALTVQQYFGKGSRIAITGRLNTYNYEKEGRKVYGFEVIVDNFSFVDTKAESKAQATEKVAANGYQETVYNNEDIPF